MLRYWKVKLVICIAHAVGRVRSFVLEGIEFLLMNVSIGRARLEYHGCSLGGQRVAGAISDLGVRLLLSCLLPL